MIVIRTLGAVQIDVGDTRVLPTSPRKFALLLYLVVERNRCARRATLQELIFPDQSGKNAQHSLRELLYQLRQARLGITSNTEGIQLPDVAVSSDLEMFVSVGRLTAEQLSAVEGGFLPGYAPEYSEAFTEWLEGYRARSTFDLCKALVADVARARRVGDWTRTERSARACLGLDPLNEEGTLALAEAMAMGGAKVQAVRFLDRYLAELGNGSSDLRLPATVLRRRICERPHVYTGTSPSPFVGREQEMSALHDHLSRARSGKSQCVAIIGEAGIGKSRLVTEFCRVIALSDVNIATTWVEPHDIHRPFGAFADLLQKLFDLPGALGVSPESMRLLDRLVTSHPVDSKSFADAVRDSDSLCHTITHSIIDLIDAITAELTLVLVVEDIPSLDSMSLHLLGHLVSSRKRRRLLLLVTMRGTRTILNSFGEGLTALELQTVPPSAIASLVTMLAARDSIVLDEPMSQWLLESSGGNPLFLESLFAHFTGTRERFSISPTLSNLLRRRVECLSERAAAALQTCAILGRYASLETLSRATQLPRFDLVRAIAELEGARLIRSDGQQVRPVHALIADVALRALGPIERRMAHQCAALALESMLDGTNSAALVWECAEQWLAADNRDRALAAIQRCANHAVEIGRPGDAAQVLARALSLSISYSERLHIARQLVTAADAAADFELVLRGVEALRGDQQIPQHDESEFAEFRARTRDYFEARDQEGELLICVSAEDATADHRVGAATQLLKYTDVAFNRTLAAKTIATLPDEVLGRASEPTRLEYMMIRHTALRELEHAAQIARRLLVVATDLPIMTRLAMSINSVIALYHSGFHDEAVRAAERCYSAATDVGALRYQLMSATFLAEHYFDANDEELSGRWMQRMDEVVDSYPTLDNDFAQGVSRLAMALADDDAPKARALFGQLDHKDHFAGGPIRIRWRKAALLRLDQLEAAAELDMEQVGALMANANQGALIGGVCDLEAAVVFHALIQAGSYEEARRFVTDYTQKHRISRAPLSKSLSKILDCLGTTAGRLESSPPH